MAIPPTYNYFGRFPTTILLQSSSNFDGNAQSGLPVLSPGLYAFPAQAGGGLFNFHDSPVEIKQIAYSGGGSCTVTKVVSDSDGNVIQSVLLTTLNSSTPADQVHIFLSPQEYLKFVSSGATSPTLSITSHLASYSADGAS